MRKTWFLSSGAGDEGYMANHTVKDQGLKQISSYLLFLNQINMALLLKIISNRKYRTFSKYEKLQKPTSLH